MDGENNGKPYFLMDDLGGFNPLFLETPISTHTAALAAEAPHTQVFLLGAVSETPEMCALRAKTHQRWKYWVPSTVVWNLSKIKKQK